MSFLTGEIRKIFDGIPGVAYSPDRSSLAVFEPDTGELLLAAPDGRQRRRLALAGPEESLASLAWSPDGRRIASLVFVGKGDGRPGQEDLFEARASAIATFTSGMGERVDVLTAADVKHAAWGGRDRLYYIRTEPPPFRSTDSLWEVPLSPETGRPMAPPRRLVRWPGQQIHSVSASADGRRIAVARAHRQSDVYIADLLAAGTALGMPRRLTVHDSFEWPSAWAENGTAVHFSSDRHGKFDLFVQGVDDDAAQPLLLDGADSRGAQLSPDRQWYLYLAWDRWTGGPTPEVRLMRVGRHGGAPEPVAAARGVAGLSFFHGLGDLAPDYPGGRGFPDLRCPASGPTCVLAEAEDDVVTFSELDSGGARLGEIARLNGPPRRVLWDVSPDGGRLAVVESFGRRADRVRLLERSRQQWREFPLEGWSTSVAWNADGESLLVSQFRVDGSDLLRVETSGRVTKLHSVVNGWISSVRPSPDGQRVAYGQATAASNVWLLEQLPRGVTAAPAEGAGTERRSR